MGQIKIDNKYYSYRHTVFDKTLVKIKVDNKILTFSFYYFSVPGMNDSSVPYSFPDDPLYVTSKEPNAYDVELQRNTFINQDDSHDWEQDMYNRNYKFLGNPCYLSFKWIQRNKSGKKACNENWSRFGVIKNWKDYKEIEFTLHVVSQWEGKNKDTHIEDIDKHIQDYLSRSNVESGIKIWDRVPQEWHIRDDSFTIVIDPYTETFKSWTSYTEDEGDIDWLDDDHRSHTLQPQTNLPAWWDNNDSGKPQGPWLNWATLWVAVAYPGHNSNCWAQQMFGIWAMTKNMCLKKGNTGSDFINGAFKNVDPDNDLVIGIIPWYENISGTEQGIWIMGEINDLTLTPRK